MGAAGTRHAYSPPSLVGNRQWLVQTPDSSRFGRRGRLVIDRSRSRGRNQKFRVEARDRDKRRENRGLRSSQPKAGRDQVEAGRATVKSTGGAGSALFAGLHKRTGALGLDLGLAAQASGVQIESQENLGRACLSW